MTVTEVEQAAPPRGRWITDWRPDDPAFWAATGRVVARRNLIWSIFAEHLGFTLWTVWSIVAVQLGAYKFSVDQLFWIVSLPNLVGSALRIPYTFAPARFGGRNFTVVSAGLLLIPAVALAVAVSDPATPYWVFLLIAATAGLGGGNFASSMANITYFYPRARQGWALGLNAAGGNVGVSSVQLVMPLVIAGLGLAWAGLFWVPLILLAAIGAYLFMDNLSTATANPGEMAKVALKGQTWIMSVLYIGTFGSFIGYSTAFPLLVKSQFPEQTPLITAAKGQLALTLAFTIPLIGSLIRPAGGRLADRLGGARVTVVTFALMAGVAGLVWAGVVQHSFWLFYGAYVVLVGLAGVGNGSTYRMIPAIFTAKAAARITDAEEAVKVGRREAAAAIGIISSIGAFGGFFINRGFGSSIAATHSAGPALVAFAAFYVLCLGLTWFCYLRTAGAKRAPGLAAVRV
ncbi:MFS transporter [Streptosporangiaceae bacterium NEAU-GS5]|nr:MFS transporter [Streptosporangiaceae bacterium NEAU-GS5]